MANQTKRGRGQPRKPNGAIVTVTAKLSPDLIAGLKRYERDAKLTRSEAIRQIVRTTLLRLRLIK